MARVAKHDKETLLARKRALHEEQKQVNRLLREAEEAERQARLARVGVLAEKFGITHVPDTVLAALFKKLAAENPAPAAAESPVDDTDDTAEAGGAAQTPSGAITPAAPGAERAAETAEVGDERKRWPWKK